MSVLIQRSQPLTASALLEPLRRGYRRGRAFVNRTLHPVRREKARERIRAMEGPARILVICLGNICRSPYGEARLAELARSDGALEVRSAGLIGPGRPSPQEALSAAGSNGLDLSDHRSRLLDGDLVAWADLVVVMDPGQARTVSSRYGVTQDKILVLGDLDPEPADRRQILDPFGKDEEVFHRTYARIDRCLSELYSLIQEPS